MVDTLQIVPSAYRKGRSQQFAIFLKGENLFPDLIIASVCLPGSTTASSSYRALA